MQFGTIRRSQASPIEQICHFLSQYSPTCKDKYVYFDQWGELYGIWDVCNVSPNWHYDIFSTKISSSHQNSPVERGHRSVGDCAGLSIFGCHVWIHCPGKRKAKFQFNIKKDILLGFVLYTTRNIKWYDYNTGHIGTTNHVLFDEDINDLTYDAIPPNQRDLERVE